jgi:hypothetical protein
MRTCRFGNVNVSSSPVKSLRCGRIVVLHDLDQADSLGMAALAALLGRVPLLVFIIEWKERAA